MTERVCDICHRQATWIDGRFAYCREHEPIPIDDEKAIADSVACPSERELELLRLVAVGATLREAAHDMGILYHTARSHSVNLQKKLQAGNLTQALAIALQYEFLTVDDLIKGENDRERV